jgi:hypothetical protein
LAEDFLNNIHNQIRARLRELDGVQAEYDQLLAAANALGVSTRRGTTARSSRSAAPRRRARTSAAAAGRNSGSAKAPSARAARGRPRKRGATSSAPARRRATASRKRAPRGANRDAVLAALRSRPAGSSARELATRAGVGRVSTYQVLGRLESEGLVSRKERGDGPALYTTR